MKNSLANMRARREEILRFLDSGEKTIKCISAHVHVSELTVRRDLFSLSEEGLIIKKHGSACCKGDEGLEGFSAKGGKNTYQKKAIALEAAKFIFPGETVFINAGTTTLEVIKCLLDKPITIVTNNAEALALVHLESKAKILCTGGEYNARNKSFSGQLATALVDIMYAQTCILGINGFDVESGLTTSFYPETMINKDFIRRTAGKKIIIADSSKCGKTKSFQSASWNQIDVFITDWLIDDATITSIRNKGVETIIAR